MQLFISLAGGVIFSGAAATILWVIAGKVGEWGCVIGTGLAGFVIVGVLDFKTWYYNARLMCIRHDECACGTVVGEPHDSFDGDRKIDILIAPFSVPETEQLQIQTLEELGASGELVDVPTTADLQNRQVRFGYMRGLGTSDQIKVALRLVDDHMFNQEGRGFLRYLYRRDESAMGSEAFSHSPDDTGANSNPMFRVNPQEGKDPDDKQLVPYMHCEVEGDSMARFLDNVLAGLVTFLAAFFALCVLCETVSLGAAGFLCGPLGAGLAFLLGLLVFAIANYLLNDPGDGKASDINVDVEDPDFDTPPGEARPGDVVYLFGDWVMDENHGQYFEIHPVKAYYLLCRSEPDVWTLTEEVPASDCAFDVRELHSEEFDRICKIVKAVEHTDPDDLFTTTVEHGLSVLPVVT